MEKNTIIQPATSSSDRPHDSTTCCRNTNRYCSTLLDSVLPRPSHPIARYAHASRATKHGNLFRLPTLLNPPTFPPTISLLSAESYLHCIIRILLQTIYLHGDMTSMHSKQKIEGKKLDFMRIWDPKIGWPRPKRVDAMPWDGMGWDGNDMIWRVLGSILDMHVCMYSGNQIRSARDAECSQAKTWKAILRNEMKRSLIVSDTTVRYIPIK